MRTIPPEPHVIRHEDTSQFREVDKLPSWQRIRHCATLKRPIVLTEDIEPIGQNTYTLTTEYATEYCDRRWCVISEWIDPAWVCLSFARRGADYPQISG